VPRIRSFRRRIFLAILAVALIPTGIALVGGTLLLREIGSGTGTLGPWDAVASSGGALIDAAQAAAPDDPIVREAARRHGEALTSSVRQSRLYTVVAARTVALLPAAALLSAVVLAALAAWAAQALSRSFAAPIAELVGWSDRIARGQALPAPSGGGGAAEFDTLRSSLRAMAAELGRGRERELEAARLRAWTEMARRVAHELKNPLTPMRMSAAALARSDDAGTREAAGIMLEEVARLDEMARTFAQFGRMPEGPAAPVDLVEMARAVVRRHDGQPVPVSLRVAGSIPSVLGHHDALARALGNLVVNGQEAVQEAGGGRVEIRITTADGDATIVVVDDGPGIPAEVLDRVWLPNVTTKRKGTGLGLALVRQAVEAHGGQVHASNRKGGGAEFTLVLPTHAADGAPVPAEPADESGAEPANERANEPGNEPAAEPGTPSGERPRRLDRGA
jgi:signal transduction histidine kinase